MNIIYQELKRNEKSFTTLFFKENLSKRTLIVKSVDVSTIRAFRQKDNHVQRHKPLSIYRYWAYNFLSDTTNIHKLNKKVNFKSFRKNAFNDLTRCWEKEDGGTPEKYKFNKLIDLFFKTLPQANFLERETKKWIFENTNVPLDKYTLTELKQWNNKLNIPKNPSMSSLLNLDYEELQNEIKKLCKEIPPLVFDLYVWGKAHNDEIDEAFVLMPLDKKVE